MGGNWFSGGNRWWGWHGKLGPDWRRWTGGNQFQDCSRWRDQHGKGGGKHGWPMGENWFGESLHCGVWLWGRSRTEPHHTLSYIENKTYIETECRDGPTIALIIRTTLPILLSWFSSQASSSFLLNFLWFCVWLTSLFLLLPPPYSPPVHLSLFCLLAFVVDVVLLTPQPLHMYM